MAVCQFSLCILLQAWGKSTRYPEARLYNFYRDIPLPIEEKDRVEAPEVVLTVTVLRYNFLSATELIIPGGL